MTLLAQLDAGTMAKQEDLFCEHFQSMPTHLAFTLV
jgi:hypothetical protein